ncbi:MAG: type II toxin-antitoxin system RelE/ParE family toxin [Planctomycetes bacterium]|nr:type II toxin-antitoxin system RelE/ParE family toxin [Planctomycetota bacterium]
MRVEILDEAEQDLVDGYRFYESQVAGLGDYFLHSLFSDIDSLQFHAGIHSVQFGFKRLLSKRFPFAVYYRIEKSIVRVHAVLDCRRDPSWIRGRLT